MKDPKNIENIQISKRLELVLQQLSTVTIFDKDFYDNKLKESVNTKSI